MKEGPQVCPGGLQARWRPISSTDIVPVMLRPSTLHSRTSPRFQLHEESPVGWFPENAWRWNEATPLCRIGCKEMTSRTYSGLWTKCTVEKRTTWMHNTTGTCQHNGLPLWLVLCLEERPGASELFEPDEGPAYLLQIENASRITLAAWLNTRFSKSKSYIISMPPILKGVLYSYSKNTANIVHQSKKKQCVLPHLEPPPLAIVHCQKQWNAYVMQQELVGFKTNHSLRVTSATRLFQGGVDEQLIMDSLVPRPHPAHILLPV